jgi:predicted ATP-grasp superfamily ATP-dependent carboligase
VIPGVVVGAGWVAGLAAIRSLGRAGVRAIAVDDRASALGFRSRYAEPRLAPSRTGAAYVEFLRELGDGVAFPTHDEDLETLARAGDSLSLIRPFPDWDVLAQIQDKRHQVAVARDVGIAVPGTADAPTDGLGFPVVVKPSDPVAFRRRFGVKAFRCATRVELDAAFAEARDHRPTVQEWIPGGDDALWTVGAYLDRGGRALGLFTGRKLRQTPRDIGTARVAEARWIPELAERGVELLRSLRFHGIAQVELKRDPRDGEYKLIEVNPRLWEWHGLAAACGVDLTRIAYLDATGHPPTPARMSREGKRWAITLARGARPALQRPPYVDAMFARDDPRPAIVHLARVLRP